MILKKKWNTKKNRRGGRRDPNLNEQNDVSTVRRKSKERNVVVHVRILRDRKEEGGWKMRRGVSIV